MRKFWLVAHYEYLKIVKQKSFLIATFSIPILIFVLMAISIMLSLGNRGNKPVGYVDYAGVLAARAAPPAKADTPPLATQAFSDEVTARAALTAGEIQCYYVLPADYRTSGAAQLFYLKDRPGELVQAEFATFVSANLLKDQPEAIRLRALEGSNLTFTSMDSSRAMETNNLLKFFVPFLAAFVFVIAVLNSAGYMIETITAERENYTIEILATSLTPEQLIGGKALGLIGVALTQMLLWATAAVGALCIAAQFLPILRGITLPWHFIGLATLFFFPAYALVAGLMTIVGGAVPDPRQAQQIAGIFNLFFTFPFFFINVILAAPYSPFILVLTLFPTTAFVTIMLRWALAPIPFWQLAVSWLLMVLSAGISIWAAARIFRIGMLRTGQRMSFKSIWRVLRTDTAR